jgi:hypothetical protein
MTSINRASVTLAVLAACLLPTVLLLACGGSSSSSAASLVGRFSNPHGSWVFSTDGSYEEVDGTSTRGRYRVDGALLRLEPEGGAGGDYSYYVNASLFGYLAFLRDGASGGIVGRWTRVFPSETTTFEFATDGKVTRVSNGDQGTWTQLTATQIVLDIRCGSGCSTTANGTYTIVDGRALVHSERKFERAR